MKIFKKISKMAMIAMTTLSTLGVCHAQQNASDSNGASSGVLTPPPPVTNVISIDAQNTLLVETQEEPGAPREYSLAVPKHIYSGGIARLFGGAVVPTELLVIPESALRSNFGNRNAGNNGGNFNGGFGNNSGIGNRFDNNDSGGNNFGGNNSGGFNRGFGQYSPRVPIRSLSDFNQVFNAIDRPIPQVQIGVGN